ncbi:CALMODULIN-BINDING PROTEIN 60 B [Salix viminalis]|uniref:CALMODULIN-BINDING PROTEIN 60 B n=1 Tax=Salix viminalis TaxID=40686 RepID=A0A9Q0V6U2_SALVM|nr:CALMODULIN-BINDING PROTEIN 60 B [Salix viminalis]
MESSRGRRVEKRGYEQSVDDAADNLPESKRAKLPALASVIVEALKVDSLQRLCSSLEPLLRRIVSEEVERALTRLGPAKLAGRTRMPPHLFTGGKVEGEQGAVIHVVLLDASTGTVVQTGPESAAKLNVVVLEGDFNEEAHEDWAMEHFESHEVKEREGKRPLLTGDLQVTLTEGVGTLGEFTFTDNSSWIRSRKFRLGVKVAPGYCERFRVREAKTQAFTVKDHRGELYKKHYPPALDDEVWRLDRIAKDGALHKKLVKADITTVEDFLRVLARDPQKLRNILGSGMSNKMWENTVEHAKTCFLGGKLYVYYADGNHSTGVVFNNIYELRGLMSDGQFLSLESLNHNQKILVDSLVKQAYDNWDRVVEYDGNVLNSLASNNRGKGASIVENSYERNHYITSAQNKQQFDPSEPSPQLQAVNNHPSVLQLIEFPFVRSDHNAVMTLNNPQASLSGTVDYTSVGTTPVGGIYFPGDWSRPRNENGLEEFFAEDIRLRSSEMLESDDMQRMLKTFGMGGVGMEPGFDQSDEACYSCSIQAYEPQMDHAYVQERGKGSGKAVVGWLKLKAALRWGIFVRKKAAERRAQLVELD